MTGKPLMTGWHGRGSTLRRQDARDRGAVAPFVALTPLMLFVIFAFVQFVLWYYAKHSLLAAAQEGARAARAQGGTVAAGQDRARRYASELGRGIIVNLDPPSVTRTATAASVTLHARVLALVPGLPIAITETSTGPLETFRPTVGAP